LGIAANFSVENNSEFVVEDVWNEESMVQECMEETPIDCQPLMFCRCSLQQIIHCNPMLTITVVVPTYRRIHDLKRCLEGLKQQSRSADEVLLVVRDTDTETWAFLQLFEPGSLPMRTVTVSLSGQVAALNAGLAAASGDIIAMTDDDAVPKPNWLDRIETYFLFNERIGGVGGRDWVHQGDRQADATRNLVGQVQWFGRLVGQHHLGAGPPRLVEFLKGANMSYRRAAIAGLSFDERLRGTGAQVHNDLAFSLAVNRSGWKLVYDPFVAVDHYPAPRFDEDQRGQFDRVALINKVYNETLILLEHLPPLRRLAYLIWAVLIGTRSYRGVVQCLRFLPQEKTLAIQKLLVALQGRWQGFQAWRHGARHSNNQSALPQSANHPMKFLKTYRISQ
jgi:glycosyltransferase involved in cell wall biosynthesis